MPFATMSANAAPSNTVTIRKLAEKLVLSEPFRDWLCASHGINEPFHLTRTLPPDELTAAYLAGHLGLKVLDDGSLLVHSFTSYVRKFLHGHEVIVHHHTSSTLLPSIQEQGLIAGVHKVNRVHDDFRGVYVTTEQRGEHPARYAARAVELFGGEAVCVSCRVAFSDIAIDKDEPDYSRWPFHQVVRHDIRPDQVLHLSKHGKVATVPASAPAAA